MRTFLARAVRLFSLSAATLVTYSCGGTLRAADVTINLSGYVTNVTGNVPTGASIGDPVHLTAVYDVAAPDQNSDPTKTFHIFSAGTAYVQVKVLTNSGTLTFASGPSGSGEPLYLWTFDQSGYSPGDYFELSANNQSGVNWPAPLFLNGFNQIINAMLDQNAPFDMIDGVNLPPAGLPDLTKVTTFVGEIRGSSSNGQSNYDIYWQFNVVPEPASWVLLLAAVMTFIVRRSNRS